MASVSLDTPTAARATVLLFWYNGLVIGVWAASIPGLRDRLALDSTGVSIALVVLGVFAITGMQLGGRLADAFGARRISLSAVPMLMAGLAVIATSRNYPFLLVGAAVLGVGNGLIDVSMNAIGVQVEANRPKPIMSVCHGMWSLGNFTGAALVWPLAVSTLME